MSVRVQRSQDGPGSDEVLKSANKMVATGDCEGQSNSDEIRTDAQTTQRSFFHCKLCSNTKRSPLFESESDLRHHLVGHFQPGILENSRTWVQNLNSSRNCPVESCRFEAENHDELVTHFTKNHQRLFDKFFPDLLNILPLDQLEIFQTLKCRHCPFVGADVEDVAIHAHKEHAAVLDALLKKLNLSNILVSVSLSPLKEIGLDAVRILSLDKDRQSMKMEVDSRSRQEEESIVEHSGNGLTATKIDDPLASNKSEKSNLSVLRSIRKPTKIEDGVKPVIYSKENKSLSTQEALNQIREFVEEKERGSVQGVFLHQARQSVPKCDYNQRVPTAQEMIEIQDDVVKTSQCQICGLDDLWLKSDNRERRKLMFARHLYLKHFHLNIKMDFLAYILTKGERIVATLIKCPKCPVQGLSLADICQHIGTMHNKALEFYWEYLTFNGLSKSPFLTVCQERKKDLGEVERIKVLSREDEDEAERLMRLYIKYGDLPYNHIMVQPEACYILSRELPPCHECYKVIHTNETSDAVCQFEGFRKIRKKPADFLSSELFKFEKVAFLDPVKDPTDEDRSLWTIGDKHLNPSLNLETAIFNLKYTAEEFCKMIQEELEVRQDYQGEVLWKRLQPQVREMCDVCSTSLFNHHWTCVDCGMLVCIDCFKTRKNGYPLAYLATKSDSDSEERRLIKPYKSRLRCLNRVDVDEHYWPMCKGEVFHQLQSFKLTQIVCGDTLREMLDATHDALAKVGLPQNCSCPRPNNSSTTSPASPPSLLELPKKKAPVDWEKLDLTLLTDCPVCGKSFDFQDGGSFSIGLHLCSHFEQIIDQKIKVTSEIYQCTLCNEIGGNLNHLRLHVGCDHLELAKILEKRQSSHSTGNIILKVDNLKRCKICGQNFVEHMMNKTAIRTHLYSVHFKGDLSKLLNDWLDSKYTIKNCRYVCKRCGYVGKNESDFKREHLGVFHHLMDLLYEKAEDSFKENQAVEDSRQNRKLITEISKRPRIESLSRSSSPLGARQSSKRRRISLDSFTEGDTRAVECDICKQDIIRESYPFHLALTHYRSTIIKELDDVVLTSKTCDACKFDARTEDDLVQHFALTHKRLDDILNIDNFSDTSSNLSVSTLSAENDVMGDLISEDVIKNGQKLYGCRFRSQKGSCGFQSHRILDAARHVLGHVRRWIPRAPPYVCQICRHESSSSNSLLKHCSRNHSILEDLEVDEQITWKKTEIKNDDTEKLTNVYQINYLKEKTAEPKEFCTSRSKPTPIESLLEDLKSKLPAELFQNDSDPPSRDFKLDFTDADDVRSETESVLHPSQKIGTVSDTIRRYPGLAQEWLCGGRLLHIMDPARPQNLQLFHEQWKRGQPVVICNSAGHLDKTLWHPRSFLRDFGHLRHDLVNCLTGNKVPKAKLEDFWRGFEFIKHRLTDNSPSQTPMLLKLKDWPPTSDFKDYMPKRYKNLFDAFPMPVYTKREGSRNLATYLPSYCLAPELGPKMYIAYGSALYSDKGSTNLHIDMSDAVNLLVYVSSPLDGDRKEDTKEVFKDVDLAGCDILMKRRVRKELPGALWHIFHPSDTVKIRNFLNKIALEKGKRLDPHDDPIHDQSTYLDGKLRERLYKEYGVLGYPIVQCAGDTVFVPAGACHQVRNLHNCIKVAEDFVSPENISHCLHLTQEFRHLTELHSNHEDKLQMKSILYHSVKCAVTVIQKQLSKDEKN